MGEAFVIPPAGIEIRHFTLKDRETERPANGLFLVQDPKEDKLYLLFCASFDFILPEYKETASVEVGRWMAMVPVPNVRQVTSMRSDIVFKPVYVLLDNWQTILDPYIETIRNNLQLKTKRQDE